VGHFIVDFVCFAQRLIVELDGGQHADATQYDAQRDTWLKQAGFRVLRFWNNEWATQEDTVLETIWSVLQESPSLPNISPSAPPSPGAARHPLPRGEREKPRELA
jgi:crossover junction endodeoxyribonuclease RuvC